ERAGGRPLGDRGLHPRPAAEPECGAERPDISRTAHAEAMTQGTVESYFKNLEQYSAKVGAAGVAALGVSYFVWGERFMQSYLLGYLLWLGLTLGCLGILLLHHLVSGAWG